MITGRYTKGCGKAHVASFAHEPYFGCQMFGTFNVRTNTDINKFNPKIEREGRRYWAIKINGEYDAWAFRWDGSKMPGTTWELISEKPLPDELKRGEIRIEIL